MGKKSVRDNKNIYQQSREAAGFTRAEASAAMVYVSDDRIEKIEYGTSAPHPDEVLTMSKCYAAPALCNYYCSHECPIGREYVPEVEMKDLSQITLEMLASLSRLTKERDRLVEITVDGSITEDEMPDFLRIKEQLEKMSLAVDALRLWLDKAMSASILSKMSEGLF